MYPQSMYRANNKINIKIFSSENFQFLKLKHLCLLHGQVFVMLTLKKLFRNYHGFLSIKTLINVLSFDLNIKVSRELSSITGRYTDSLLTN